MSEASDAEEGEGFFRVACADALRIVSILALDSADVTRPRSKNSFLANAWEKATFLPTSLLDFCSCDQLIVPQQYRV